MYLMILILIKKEKIVLLKITSLFKLLFFQLRYRQQYHNIKYLHSCKVQVQRKYSSTTRKYSAFNLHA